MSTLTFETDDELDDNEVEAASAAWPIKHSIRLAMIRNFFSLFLNLNLQFCK